VSSGYIHFYFGNAIVPDLATFEYLLEPVGLHLEKPGTGRVVALSPTGEQVIATRERILSLVGERRGVSFQWWYARL
jgi:hypothetical protein